MEINNNSVADFDYYGRSFYWERCAKDMPHLKLFTDFDVTDHRDNTGEIKFKIHSVVVSELMIKSNQESNDLFTILLAFFYLLLYRYTGQKEIGIGSNINLKSNLFPLCNTVNGNDTFITLLQRVKATLADAYKHADVPFELNEIGPFEAVFNFNNFKKNNSDKCGITFHLFEADGGLSGCIEYDASLYLADTIGRMAAHYLHLINEVIISPPETPVQALNMLSEKERDQLLYEFNSYAAYPLDKTAIDLFKEQARALPDSIALLYEDEQLTYRQLDERSNQLAHYLRSLHAGPETTIAICIERGMNMIIGILGIMKAGAAYVPIDPQYPGERINYILNDADCKLMVTSTSGLKNIKTTAAHQIINLDTDHDLINSFPADELDHQLTANNLAYIIYTSGSTGQPKGVMIEHGGLSNLIFNHINFLKHEPGLKILQFASFSFDGSCYEIFNTLCLGDTLVLVNNEQILSSAALQQVIKKHNVDIATLPPSYQQVVKDNILDLKVLYSAGEPLNPVMGKLIQQQGIKLINGYGPTENTVAISFTDNPIINNKAVIGKPLKNVQVYILDENRQLVPVGVTGEIYVGGAQLARGYWRKEALTAEKFIINPFSAEPGLRLYRTGDLARWLPDGNMDYMGRVDEQVKIRGYRIELGEIESLIKRSELVKEAVVLCKTDKQENKQLVSYVIPADHYDKELLYHFLKLQLPAYMIPNAIVEKDEFPLTPNGKIDRKFLTQLDILFAKSTAYTQPRNELESKLVKIWQNILGDEKIGVDDNFFDLGGSSLLAILIIAQTEEVIGKTLTVGSLYQYPTIAEFSRVLSDSDCTAKNSLVLMKKGGDKPPLYMIHPSNGNVICYNQFVELLDDDQPVYGLQSVLKITDEPLTVEETAARYVEEILHQNPSGPYMLSGWSLGGSIAFEMARQMEKRGLKVSCVFLFESIADKRNKRLYPETTGIAYRASHLLKQLKFYAHSLTAMNTYHRLFNKLLKKPEEVPLYLQTLIKNQIAAGANYRITYYNGPVTLFRAKTVLTYLHDPETLGWRSHVKSLKVIDIEGSHNEIFRNEHIKSFTTLVQKEIYLIIDRDFKSSVNNYPSEIKTYQLN